MSDFETALQQLFTTGDLYSITSRFDLTIPRQAKFTLSNLAIELLDTGVLCIEPKPSSLPANRSHNTSDIILSAGIHGNETAPIEILNLLLRKIFLGEIKPQNRLLFIIGNPVAMNANERFMDVNLNRLFGNKQDSVADCYEARRAAKLTQYVTDFFITKQPANQDENTQARRFHYDLHTAIRASKYEKFAVYPYLENHQWNKQQLEFLHACGINTVLFNNAPATTFSYFSSSRFSADAFTLELGRVKPFGENNMADFTDIITNLANLIEGKPVATVAFENKDFNLFRVLDQITRRSADFRLFISPDEMNFKDFPAGTRLSEDTGEEYVTQQANEAIIFPNANVQIGHRAALIVIPTSI